MVVKTAISEAALRHFVGEIVAVDVSLEDYMANYAAEFCEWIEGVVIKMSPVTGLHDEIVYFLRQLLQAYLELRPIGKVRSQPFVMRLPAFPKRRREPDVIVVLDTNRHELRETYMDGPADIVIEVVSEESIERDYGEKFHEYEKGGVPEYWTIDSLRRETRFYRLHENGLYQRHMEDENGNYMTPALPGLLVHVPTLWLPNFPGPGATFQGVSKMLED
jgi:Uma2 family endonuclease